MKNSLVSILLLTTVTGACSGSEPVAESSNPEVVATAGWSAPQKYEFDLSSACGERTVIGRFHIVVKDDRVINAKGLDESGKSLVASQFRDEIPTLEDVLDEAAEARRADADVVGITSDESDGHPARVDIDYDTSAIDDEACYVVTNYREL
jgi:hypothetical protein